MPQKQKALFGYALAADDDDDMPSIEESRQRVADMLRRVIGQPDAAAALVGVRNVQLKRGGASVAVFHVAVVAPASTSSDWRPPAARACRWLSVHRVDGDLPTQIAFAVGLALRHSDLLTTTRRPRAESSSQDAASKPTAVAVNAAGEADVMPPTAQPLPGAILPYRCSEVFAVNALEELSITPIQVGSAVAALQVDNVYADPERVRQLVLRHPTAMWKGDQPEVATRNWLDYYDCRTAVSCGYRTNALPPIHELLLRLVATHFGVHGLTTSVGLSGSCEFNLHRFLRPRRRQRDGLKEQSYPHRDSYNPDPAAFGGFAAVVYLNSDEEASGGTRFYAEMPPPFFEGMDAEAADTFIDASGYNVLAEVPMRFNRMVIYRGTTTHGAWFGEDADVRFGVGPGSQWRLVQVLFTSSRS